MSVQIPKFNKNPLNTRVPGICKIRICWIVSNCIRIGTLSEEVNDAGEFDWVIRIDWEAWERAGRPNIPGIWDEMRLDEYVRAVLPVIVSQRTLPDNRDRLMEELQKVGLTHNDRFEFMLRTGGRCGNNDLTMERMSDSDQAKMIEGIKERIKRGEYT